MVSRPSLDGGLARPRTPRRVRLPVKIVIAGGFGVGKTTAVAAISDVPPLSTEAAITSVAADIDLTGAVPAKTTTTVALDFGRVDIDEGMVLYLFGTPGQDRFGFFWDDLIRGALGALVVVDTRRITDSYPAVDYFEQTDIPFVVAVNLFDGSDEHGDDDVRDALALDPAVPLVRMDARDDRTCTEALIRLVQHALELADP